MQCVCCACGEKTRHGALESPGNLSACRFSRLGSPWLADSLGFQCRTAPPPAPPRSTDSHRVRGELQCPASQGSLSHSRTNSPIHHSRHQTIHRAPLGLPVSSIFPTPYPILCRFYPSGSVQMSPPPGSPLLYAEDLALPMSFNISVSALLFSPVFKVCLWLCWVSIAVGAAVRLWGVGFPCCRHSLWAQAQWLWHMELLPGSTWDLAGPGIQLVSS